MVFMAMPFGDDELDQVYRRHLRPAVAKTGFILQRVDEQPTAGLIDYNMELMIRRSRFVIADLTQENRGAYWEAGFAEGLGKPVVYTCRRSYFEQHKTHFDTSHRQTVTWSSDTIDADMDRLKTIIRVTLPSDAKLEDD